MTRPLLFSLTLAYSISPLIAQQTTEPKTIEQRLVELEKRVAELEKKGTEKNDSPTKQPDKKEPQKLVFQDGFETGTAQWDISEKRIFMPYTKGMSQSQTQLWTKKSDFSVCDPWRTTKSITIGGRSLKAEEGKRFLTATAAGDGIAKVQTAIDSRTGYSTKWRGIRYVIQKKTFSTKDLKLPVATFKAHLDVPSPARHQDRSQGLFQAGYIIDGDTVDRFVSLMTLDKSTAKGWESFEIDLSSAPKDKKIKLVFMSMMADSRFKASTGLQLDDVKVFDDAQ